MTAVRQQTETPSRRRSQVSTRRVLVARDAAFASLAASRDTIEDDATESRFDAGDRALELLRRHRDDAIDHDEFELQLVELLDAAE